MLIRFKKGKAAVFPWGVNESYQPNASLLILQSLRKLLYSRMALVLFGYPQHSQLPLRLSLPTPALSRSTRLSPFEIQPVLRSSWNP